MNTLVKDLVGKEVKTNYLEISIIPPTVSTACFLLVQSQRSALNAGCKTLSYPLANEFLTFDLKAGESRGQLLPCDLCIVQCHTHAQLQTEGSVL